MLAVKGGRILTVTAGVLENGTILIENGLISYAGQTPDIPEGCEVIDASGCWVTPGLIDAHTHISIFERPKDLAGLIDGNETADPITPQLRAIDALNPRDIGVAVARNSGFTTCYTMPGSANVIGGSGIAFKTKKADTVLDMVLPGTEQMKFALGESPRYTYGKRGKMPSTRLGVASLLREALYKAKAYSLALLKSEETGCEPPEFDCRSDALLPAVRGNMICRIHCHRADDIVTAIRIADEFGLKYALDHVTEGHFVAEYLRKHDAFCVVGPLNMSMMKMETWNAKLETPGILDKAGVRLCLTQDGNDDMQFFTSYIGLCIAKGLPFDSALRAVTINPARLLGLDDRIGSIEEGKAADLAIFDGDPFCNLTRCRAAVIDGVYYPYNESEVRVCLP